MMVVAEVFEEAAPAILQRLYQRGANPHAVDEVRGLCALASWQTTRHAAVFPRFFHSSPPHYGSMSFTAWTDSTYACSRCGKLTCDPRVASILEHISDRQRMQKGRC